MKRLALKVLGLVTLLALGASATRAELIMLSFHAQESRLRLRGNAPDQYWDTYGYATRSVPITVDLVYDSTTAPVFTDGSLAEYHFTDALRNYWRVRSYDLPALPNVEIIRPLQSIRIDSIGRLVANYWDEATNEEFELSAEFAVPFSTGAALPTPPLPPLLHPNPFASSQFDLVGFEDMFNLPSPGEGLLSALFTDVDAQIGDHFPPVPEPATYGLAGALLLGALAARRRFAQRRA